MAISPVGGGNQIISDATVGMDSGNAAGAAGQQSGGINGSNGAGV